MVNLVERNYRKRSFGCYVASDDKERRGAKSKENGEGKAFRGTVHIVQEDIIHGEFFEHFELRTFPFDLQSLSVRVRAREEPTCQTFCFPSHDGRNGRRKSSVYFEGKRMKFSSFSGSANIIPEWEYVTDERVNTLCHIEKAPPGSKYAKVRHNVFVFNQPVNRRAGYYMCNVVPLYAFLVAFGWMCLADDLVDSANRLNFIVALVLTSTAFKYTFKENLPRVHYITSIDWYIYFVYLLFTIQAGMIAYVKFKLDADDSHE